jgi:hypothetical protein
MSGSGRCPNCNRGNREGAMFCKHCGEPLFAKGGAPEAEPRLPGPVDLYAPDRAAAPVYGPAGWPSQGAGQYYPADINVRTPRVSKRRKGNGYGWVGAALAGCVVLGLLAFAVMSFMRPDLKVGPPPGWRNATQAEWDIINGQTNGRLDAESLFVPETVNPYVNTIMVVKVVDLPLMPEVPDTCDLEVMQAYVNDHRGDFKLGEEFSDEGAAERIESVEAVRMDCGQCAFLARSWTTYAEMKVVEDVVIARKGSRTYGIAVMNVVGANNDLEVTHILKNARFE